MEAKLIIGGNEINIGIELLGSIASSLADSIEHQQIFHSLAQSSSANIRQEIAYKDKISNETVLLLFTDKDSAVLERILRNDLSKELMTDLFLENIINDANEEVLKTIANNLDGYENVNIENIAKKLISLGNPAVRLSLAENYGISKKILKELLKDTDPDVVRAAKNTLS